MRRPLCAFALILAASLRILLLFAPAYDDPYLAQDGEMVTLVGRVTAKEYKSGTNTWTGAETLTLLLTIDHVELPGADCASSDQVLVRVPVESKDNELDPATPIGAWVRVQGTLAVFQPATVHGAFDSQLYYRTLGYVFQVRKATVQASAGRGSLVDNALYGLRQRLHNVLYRCCVSEEDAGILAAMLLGEKGGLSQEIRDLYQSAGIIHILAISGLHIQIIGMGCYRLLGRLRMPRPARAALAVVLMLLYGRMTGVSASSCRALIMFLLHILAQSIHRTYDLLSALSVAGMLLLLDQPLYLYNSGFLFSFGAVLAIGLLTPLLPADILPARGKRVLWRQEERMRERVTGKSRSTRMTTLPGISLQGLAATIGTFPVNLCSYGTFPFYSVALNALVLPLMSLVMILGLLLLGGGLVLHWFGIIPAWPVHYLLHFYRLLCGIAASLPGHIQVVGHPESGTLIAFLVLMGVLVMMSQLPPEIWERLCLRDGAGRYTAGRHAAGRGATGKGAGDRRTAGWNGSGANAAGPHAATAGGHHADYSRGIPGIAVLLWMTACLQLLTWHNEAGLRIHVIDVGQGDGIYIECDGSRILIDGGSTDQSELARYTLEPLLTWYGADTIDLAIMTHEDEDHMSGLLELLGSQEETGIRIRRIALPDIAASSKGENYLAVERAASAAGTQIVYLHQGSEIRMGRLTLTCLNPVAGAEIDAPNETSIVLYAAYGAFTALFTGDLEGEGESACLAYMTSRADLFCHVADGDPATYDTITFLKTAHHGSRGATTEAFLTAVHPQYAAISCGMDNRYGHPHAETLDRLHTAGAQILDTRYNGEITLTTDGRTMRVQPFLDH